MPDPMTAREIQERQREWHEKWTSIDGPMWNTETARLLAGLIERLSRHDKGGWPTRGETVEEC